MSIGQSVSRGVPRPSSAGPYLLILIYIGLSCFSLASVAERYGYFHFYYDPNRLLPAAIGVLFLCAMVPLFALTRFSFGWGVGFYLFVTAAGFVWLSFFSKLNYDHDLARISVATSIAAFLIPALLLNEAIPRRWTMSTKIHDRLLLGIQFLALITILICSTYGFRLVSLGDIYVQREALAYPTVLNYLININTTALLPYVFACSLLQKRYLLLVSTVALGLLFYPVTFSKLALAAPIWMIFLTILTKWFEARLATILSLLIIVSVGLFSFYENQSASLFGLVNFRMLAIPSSAIDHYSEFFTHNPLTHFCQVSFFKDILECPYSEQLSVVMENAYHLGNMNASLLATEGIASVGFIFSPISALVCGLVFAVGNACSNHLPERFVLISGAILAQAILNVAFTTTMLTHGAVILFGLWYLTPNGQPVPETRAGDLIADSAKQAGVVER